MQPSAPLGIKCAFFCKVKWKNTSSQRIKHCVVFLQTDEIWVWIQVSFGCLWGSACTRGTESTFITLTNWCKSIRLWIGNEQNRHCILETSWQEFFGFGAAIHLVGRKVKVMVSMNIWLHDGKHPQLLYFKSPVFLHKPIGFTSPALHHLIHYISVVRFGHLGPLQECSWSDSSTK